MGRSNPAHCHDIMSKHKLRVLERLAKHRAAKKAAITKAAGKPDATITREVRTLAPTADMCGLTYDFITDHWVLRHPNGALVTFDRHMVGAAMHTNTGLITFSEANKLVWQVFGTSLENLMGPYKELVTVKEGWDGGWAPPRAGSLPVPRSPMPPPPKPSLPSPSKSVRGGFGRVSERKRSKVRKQLQALESR